MTDFKEKTGRLSLLIKAFESRIGIFSITHFASFVSDHLTDPSVVFFQDDSSIYLRYHKYWAAFQRYCSQNGIILTISAPAFRRKILAPKKLISPQYEVPSGNQYPRYDYRKIVDGREEIVLKLSRKILKLK